MGIAIIAFIILLVVLVVIHEFGHFIAARKSGVTVHEFAVGMWPKVWSFGKDKRWTEFTLRLLPLGGFVRIKGESPHDEGAFTNKDSFLKARFRQKVIILLGGVTMNIIAAWIIFTIGFTKGVYPIQIIPDNFIAWQSESLLMPTQSYLESQWFLSGSIVTGEALIVDVLPWQLADKAGLMSGDTIMAIDKTPIDNQNIGHVLKEKLWQTVSVVYTRSGVQQTTTIDCPTESCVLGIFMENESNIQMLPVQFPFGKAIVMGWREIIAQAKLTFPALGGIVKSLLSSRENDRQAALNNLSWPVGAARVGEFIIETGGWVQFLMFGGMISLALAFFNLLPIPALDGGRLLGVIIQKAFRLRAEKYFAIEWVINLVFFVLLLGLGIYIIGLDLVRAWGVRIPGIG